MPSKTIHLCQCGCGAEVGVYEAGEHPPVRMLGKPKRFKQGHKPRRPVAERFWEKVDKADPNGCWVWTAQRDKDGYGCFKANRRPFRAHRFAYELLVGPIPEGLVLDHLCSNPACVNPAHLEPVTRRENTLRGDTMPAVNSVKTHCKHGHEFTVENTYVPPGTNKRGCRTCLRRRAREYQKGLRSVAT